MKCPVPVDEIVTWASLWLWCGAVVICSYCFVMRHDSEEDNINIEIWFSLGGDAEEQLHIHCNKNLIFRIPPSYYAVVYISLMSRLADPPSLLLLDISGTILPEKCGSFQHLYYKKGLVQLYKWRMPSWLLLAFLCFVSRVVRSNSLRTLEKIVICLHQHFLVT